MSILVISEDDIIKTNKIIAYAEAHIVTYDYLKAVADGKADPIGNTPENSMYFFNGYRVVFSIDEQLGGLMKHLSISHRDMTLPLVFAARRIMELFKFKNELENCIVWKEDYGHNTCKAINIVEPHAEATWDDFKKKEK